MENLLGGSVLIYILIGIILPITLFIGIILICIRLGAILDLLENIENKNDAIINILIENKYKKDYNHKDI